MCVEWWKYLINRVYEWWWLKIGFIVEGVIINVNWNEIEVYVNENR